MELLLIGLILFLCLGGVIKLSVGVIKLLLGLAGIIILLTILPLFFVFVIPCLFIFVGIKFLKAIF